MEGKPDKPSDAGENKGNGEKPECVDEMVARHDGSSSGRDIGRVHRDERIFTFTHAAYHGLLNATRNNDAANQRQAKCEKGTNETYKIKHHQTAAVV